MAYNYVPLILWLCQSIKLFMYKMQFILLIIISPYFPIFLFPFIFFAFHFTLIWVEFLSIILQLVLFPSHRFSLLTLSMYVWLQCLLIRRIVGGRLVLDLSRGAEVSHSSTKELQRRKNLISSFVSVGPCL